MGEWAWDPEDAETGRVVSCDRKDTGREQPCADAGPGRGTGKGVKTVSASVAADFIFV